MFLSEDLEQYIQSFTTEEDGLMRRLERETYQKVVHPRMLSGPDLGVLLRMISYMIRPGRILEVGTYTGYGTISLARGLAEGGIMHTIEANMELEDMISRYLDEAGLRDRVVTHFGDALKIIPSLDETFDLVFIDAAKEQYLDYYRMVMDKLRAGGFILADNVLWDGKVLQPELNHDKETQALVTFSRFVHEDERVENTILPVRDGVMVIRKIPGL
jgi:predicted O-methyltransferase YrrM